MTEFGIFNDEGLVEGQFYTEADAVAAAAERYADDEWIEVRQICPDHAEQPAYGCEECEQ